MSRIALDIVAALTPGLIGDTPTHAETRSEYKVLTDRITYLLAGIAILPFYFHIKLWTRNRGFRDEDEE